MSDVKQILSLGAGVQSTTVLLMSINGELPRLDAAIFADTGWEPQEVYKHLDWLITVMERAGVPFYRVAQGNVKEDALRSKIRGKSDKETGERWASLPLYVESEKGQGMIRRQCTAEYKIMPIERCIRKQILGLKPRQRAPKELVVRHWFGISHDERQRMRISNDAWKENWYPLVERRMTRQQCIQWCLDHGYPQPPRSACIACPFKHNREWRHLQKTSPEEFQEAVEFDSKIRHCGGMRGDAYVHGSLKPLGEVDLRSDVERGQTLLPGFEDECAGVCDV